MPNKKKSLASRETRLTNFVCVDKERLHKELSQFQAGVKSKEEVEATADVFFEQMRRLNLGVK